jgi:hypothetical protein
MFADSQSLESYLLAWSLGEEDAQCRKFSQIYKNNLVDIDDSNMASGNVYQHLQRNISNAFGSKSNILVADSQSIDVEREYVQGSSVDTFAYNVLMDVHVM